MKHLLYFVFLLLLAGCSSTDQPEIPAVTKFDIHRYTGTWYEIARLPNFFEKGLQNVSAEYTLLPDGMIRVVNRGVKNGKEKSISGFARFAGSANTGELEVSFFRPFYSPYRIIHLDPEYTVACVMGKNTSFAWILARTPELPPEKLVEAVNFLRKNGFAVEKLIYPAQEKK